MTSIICKLMESIVRDKIVNHMIKNDLFSPRQHGFVPLRNCTTNLLMCIENWTECLENGLPVVVICTDFANALNRVPHKRLLKKLENIGIVGNTLNWVKSFLSNRTQCVRVGNEYSPWSAVKSGTTRLHHRPILFVIFINDMHGVVKSIYQIFADDAKIYSCIQSPEDIKKL